MVYEFVGGPWDGEVRDMSPCQSWHVPVYPVYDAVAMTSADIPPHCPRLYEHVYETRTRRKDGKKYMVWQGVR